MPRMQVYLPDDLHRAVKEHGLAVSALLQEALRVELRRRELSEATDDYLAELIEEIGLPDPNAAARAEAIARRLSSARERA